MPNQYPSVQCDTPYRVLVYPNTAELIELCKQNELHTKDNKMFISYLTADQYALQLKNADAKWKCPKTLLDAWFDDTYFEAYFEK